MALDVTYEVAFGWNALNPGGWPLMDGPLTLTPISRAAWGNGVMSSSEPPISLYSSSESPSSESTSMREASRESVWQPLQSAFSVPFCVITFEVTSTSFSFKSPNPFFQIWPPMPCAETADFQ
jgi:hypothetical protein